MSRSGFGLIEVLVALGLCAVVAAMVCAFSTGASSSSARTLASEDATRSILLASETIGQDLRRSLVDTVTPDLSVSDGGRTLRFKMATAKYKNWTAPSEIVSYVLEPAGKDTSLKQLVRVTARGRHVIRGCLLKDLLFQTRAPGPHTPWRMTVLVTIVAALSVRDVRTVNVEIPVTLALPPPAYPWPPPGSGKP